MGDGKYAVRRYGRIVLMLVLLASGFHAAAQTGSGQLLAAPSDEWLTWGYDQERTLWNRAEKVLSKDNVGQLSLKWKVKMPTPASMVVLQTLTTPLVVSVNLPQGPALRVFVVGSDNTVYAVDANTGAIAWQRAFPHPGTPKDLNTGKEVIPDYRCPGTQNATPVIDKESGIIYVSTSDGKLRGLNIVNGEDRMLAIDFTHPFARNWSLNLIDGVIYSPTARGCFAIPSHLTAVDLKDPSRQKREFFTGPGVPNGAWGRGGIVRGPKYLYVQTADGPYDPGAGRFGNSVLAFTFKDLRLVDSYTPENWEYLNAKDLDLSSANAVAFPFQGRTIVASVGKESVVSLLDGDGLGAKNHQTPLYASPRWGNDEAMLHDRGVWGAMATWEDVAGRRYLAMSMLGPVGKSAPPFKYSYGPANDGSLMTFEVRQDPGTGKPMLEPLWISREMHAPDVPVVANGVVYAFQSGKDSTETRAAGVPGRDGGPGRATAPGATSGSAGAAARGSAGRSARPTTLGTNAILYAFDAATGKELFRSELDSFNHFTNPVVAGGTVYAATWDGTLYAFASKSK